MPKFELNAAYKPVADQPAAMAGLAQGIEDGDRFQTLLGVTGSGKTATMAFAIEQVQRPSLVIAHNKTLAAQLCNEFREFFPKNSVEYFVSYYDYYQPEAYVPAQDLYIEKDSSINEEIDRLRHSATSALFARRDVIVVASVSCIYGLGSPQKYNAQITILKKGEMVDRDEILRKLVDNMYTRNDQALGRGTFRVRGETLEVFPAYAETAYRAVFFGDEIEAIQHFDPLTGEVFAELEHAGIWPATHYATDRPTIERAVVEIRDEMEARCKELEEQGKLLESHRLRQRTQFDMEMMRELGFCNGIENYSRILDGRAAGRAPLLPARLLPGRLRLLHRRVAPDRARRSAACTRATARARRRSWSTASGCRARSTTGRRRSTSSSSTRRRSCSCRPRRATSSATTRRRSSSRSCARPASWTPRSTCARRRTRSTT